MDISDFKILVISMPKSRKRRAFMDFKLKGLGLNYEFFDALETHAVKEKYNIYEDWCRVNGKSTLMGGLPSYACLLSHCLFFQNNPSGNYLVLEDDVYLHKRFFQITESLPSNIAEIYDMLYFGYNNYELSPRQKEALDEGELFLPVEKNVMTHGGYGLIYTPAAMDHLKKVMSMDMPHEEVRPNDNTIWMHAAYKLRSAIVNPPLVIPEVRLSNIRESRDMQLFCEQRLINLDDYMHLDLYETYAGLD